MKQAHGGAGHSAKHSGTAKHTQGKGKHHHKAQPKKATGHHAAGTNPVHVVGKQHKAGKRRGLALTPADVACCAAEAVAMSLRLAGGRVTDDDVLGLYFNTASGPDDGASIEETLEAAAELGLAGCRPVSEHSADATARIIWSRDDRDQSRGWLDRQALQDWRPVGLGSEGQDVIDVEVAAHGLILGLDLPEGSHAVLATEDGWWSWGRLYPASAFSESVVEEVWAVSWS